VALCLWGRPCGTKTQAGVQLVVICLTPNFASFHLFLVLGAMLSDQRLLRLRNGSHSGSLQEAGVSSAPVPAGEPEAVSPEEPGSSVSAGEFSCLSSVFGSIQAFH
jgi:hypothetical protein